MFVRFEENPNCGFVDDRVWNEHGSARVVTHVLRTRDGKDVWCPVTGVNEKGEFIPAIGIKVEDSGDAMCWLVHGGLWGVRMKDPSNTHAWSLEDASQWGEGFLLLPSVGTDVRFA